jgi:hypothetical protein
MTEGGRVAPRPVSAHPSASCVSNPADALGLQHDVEATPKGDAILNTDVQGAARGDTQLLLDATDAPGRCHDQGPLSLQSPRGGLEIIDVTDIENPQVIGLTSHIGQSHTVNVDPRRPHIAYSVTSDAVGVNAEGERANENPATLTGNPGLSLDGFEMVDLSSCMNFPAGTTLEQKRARCRPEVYRYRYPSTEMSLGHTNQRTVYGCHELEVYPDDRLMCGGGAAMIALDMRGAFDDRGTASTLDDKLRGTPLPCTPRASRTPDPLLSTTATVIDCVDGQGEGSADLGVNQWLTSGAPSLEGVNWIGSAFHQGRETTQGNLDPAFPSTEDIDFNHESELTNSGRYVLATDERGGGVVPPGASCSPTQDLPMGNGGVHAYDVNKLLRRRPASAEDAHSSYARNSQGGKAIYRAPIRTRAQESLCTAHVLQQIPGQNRIFMGWYSQGTQVVDFTENPDGTLDFKDAGYFIPAQANQWVSHVFKVQDNRDGTFTYFGTAADFALSSGRNAVEVYKVTLPAPPAPRGQLAGTGTGFRPDPADARRARQRGCMSRSLRIGRKRVGRLRLNRSRGRITRLSAPRPLGTISRRTRVLRYCVKGGKPRNRAVAIFDRRNRMRISATSAAGHKYRGVRRGSPRRALGKRFDRVRRIGPSARLVRPRRGPALVFVLRQGRVRYVAVADRRIAGKPRILRSYLRRARLP